MLIHPHKRTRSKSNKKGFFDYAIYPIAIFSSIVTLPQLAKVWIDHDVAGISLLTWGAYTLLAGLWFLYGIFKKQMPLIVGNLLICVLDALIVIGILMYS